MSIAELVPSSSFRIAEPSGSVIPETSFRGRLYQMRSDKFSDFDVVDVMHARGIDDADTFLQSALKNLPDPSILMDMDIASSRLADAVMKREKVLVFGDYDVDGACSSAIMKRFMRLVGTDCDVYIPDRAEDGYGPSLSAFSKCKPSDYDLTIFVDCGTASASLINELKCDVIIVDHHKQQGELPFVHACVNPHRDDDTSNLDMVCAAGLAFMVCAATRRTLRGRNFFEGAEPDLRDLVDLAAMATVSDVVPLIGLSRILVSAGLEVMKRNPSIGVSALMSAAGVEDPTAGKIGFGLGPRINAAGRVGGGTSSQEGALGFELLVCEDPIKANMLAARLNSLNSERQSVEKAVLEQAKEMAQIQADNGAKIICVASEEWHQGVIGIVAGRIREAFSVPAIVGSIVDGNVKASGRSVPGFDLGSVIIEARSRGLLAGGGGHAMACGLSVPKAGWEDFIAFANEKSVWNDVPVAVDSRLDSDDVSIEIVESFDVMEPLGQGNPSPVALFDNFRVKYVKTFGKGHIRIVSNKPDLEVIFWRAEDEGIAEYLLSLEGKKISVIGVPKVSEWNGKKKVSINASDIIS